MATIPQLPAQHQTSRRFIGLDLFRPAGDLGPGYLTQADNLFIDGGEAVTRPGKAGQWTAPLPAPLYAPLPFLKADGTTALLLSSGGRLYQAPKGGAAPSEILNAGTSFSLNSPAVRMARLGQYAYAVDGAGPLIRTDLVSGGVAQGLAVPPVAPAAALTQGTLDAMAGPAGFAADALAPGQAGNLVVNGDFVSGGVTFSHSDGDGAEGSVTAISGWSLGGLGQTGGGIELYGSDQARGQPGLWCSFNDVTDTLTSGPLPNAPVVNASAVGGAGGVTGRHARHFRFGGRYQAPYADSDLTVSVTAFSDAAGTAQIGRASTVLAPATVGGAVGAYDHLFDLSAVPAEILSVVLELQCTNSNHDSLTSSLLFTDVTLAPVVAALTLGTSGGSLAVSLGAPYPGGAAPLGALELTRTLPAAADFSMLSHVALGYAAGAGVTGVALAIALWQSGAAAPSLSNAMALSGDGAHFAVDISTIPASSRTNIVAYSLVFSADPAVPAPVSGAALFTLGPLTDAGNLSVGAAAYTYVYTEVRDPSFVAGALLPSPQALESDASPASVPLTPTTLQATALVTPPAPANAGTNFYNVYRFGGVYADGLARLVATLPAGQDYAAGADADNPHVAWDHAARTLTDDTPDSFLLAATVLQVSRDAPPTGAQCVCAWQGRLWLAKGSTLYASWEISDALQNALYFTSVNLTTDPSAAVKGATFSLGGPDNDPIQALIPYGTNLIVLKQYSVWMIYGYDPTNFAAQSYLLRAGVGCVAPNAACVVGNHVWFLSANGVYQFDADVVDPRSVELQPALNPHGDAGEPVIDSSAYRQSWMVYHDRRLLLGVPAPGDGAPTVAYVWDARTSGWTKYLQMNMTGGASLSAATDKNDLFLAGQDGQLYELHGSVDVAAPGAAGQPIPWALASRGFGQEDDSDGFYRRDQPTRGYFFAEVRGGAEALDFTVLADDPPQTFTVPYTVAGTAAPRIKLPGGMRGYLLTVQLSGAATHQVRVRGLGLDLVKGQTRE